MKTSKRKPSANNGSLKSPTPTRMKSAVTNLDRLIQETPEKESAIAPDSTIKTKQTTDRKPETKEHPAPETIVEVQTDIGFGNALFIRGEGLGLSWEKGVPLDCRDGSTWIWSVGNGTGPAEFKLLLNDTRWANGENLRIAPGQRIQVRPSF